MCSGWLHGQDRKGEVEMNRNSKLKAIAFCVLAAASLASWPARAETIYLDCGADKITVDLTNNTASNANFTVPATINERAIDFVSPGETVWGHYHIDRTQGTLALTVTYRFPKVTKTRTYTYPCTVGTPPPAKF